VPTPSANATLPIHAATPRNFFDFDLPMRQLLPLRGIEQHLDGSSFRTGCVCIEPG
jgi:hypothetical protein